MNPDFPAVVADPDTRPAQPQSADDQSGQPGHFEKSEQPEKSEQSELDLGVISTGSAEIDRALQPLLGLGAAPVADHPELFESVLGELSAAMTESSVDEGHRRD